MRPTGLSGIAYCHFAEHQTTGERKLSIRRVVVFGFAPIAIGILLLAKLDIPQRDNLELIVAVLSVVAAVLLGLLPLAHSILGQADSKRIYVEGERPLAQQELDRIQTLQDLHAAISWSVILLVFALGACAASVLLPSIPVGTTRQGLWKWVEYGLVIILYSVMASSALTFFDVSRGVFEGMESYAESTKRCIRNNIGRSG